MASVRSHLQHHLNTVKGRPYRRHTAGQGKAYRLRGGLPEESGADLSPSLCGKDGQYQLREGQENAAFTTRGLDSSFAASIASTTLDGDRNGEGEGEGEGERGTSGYAEEDGKLEEAGSSIGGGGGDSLLSGPAELVMFLFHLLHQRRYPSRRSRLTPTRLRRPGGVSALRGWGTRRGMMQAHGRQSRATSTTAGGGTTSGGRGGGGGKLHEQRRRVLCMTRGCTDGTGPWPTMAP